MFSYMNAIKPLRYKQVQLSLCLAVTAIIGQSIDFQLLVFIRITVASPFDEVAVQTAA